MPFSKISTRVRVALVASMAAGLLAVSCTLVGQGDLHISNDLSGIGRDNTIFRAWERDAGDPIPPAGFVSIFVRGDDFGHPPSYGMNGYLYLVRTDLACPQSEGRPESFTLGQVTIVGVVTVTNGTVNQFVLMPDSAANRQDRFALMDIGEIQDFPGEHLLHRCGTITWS